VLSADGSIVTFNSYATDLVAGVSVPFDSSDNVYYTPLAATQSVVTASSLHTTGTSFTVMAEDSTGQSVAGPHSIPLNGQRPTEETPAIANISDPTFTTGLTITLTNLSKNATLTNESGAYQGNPNIDLATPTGGLGQHQSNTVNLILSDPTPKPVNFDSTENEERLSGNS
jgi:hypothetical protein